MLSRFVPSCHYWQLQYAKGATLKFMLTCQINKFISLPACQSFSSILVSASVFLYQQHYNNVHRHIIIIHYHNVLSSRHATQPTHSKHTERLSKASELRCQTVTIQCRGRVCKGSFRQLFLLIWFQSL